MIKNEKKGLIAIHKLLIKGRMLVNELEKAAIFSFFDEIEYLPALILSDKDDTKEFGEYLKGICQEFNCNYIYEQFID